VSYDRKVEKDVDYKHWLQGKHHEENLNKINEILADFFYFLIENFLLTKNALDVYFPS
jgi:hypothetical protein